MKFGVIIFPGSNCDRDVIYVLEHVLKAEVTVLWHNTTDLSGLETSDCVILPGGFSYGDYLRSGSIARFSPIMQAVKDFASNGGYVFGICNGFQILCESGLLPGALLKNENPLFKCENIHIKAVSLNSPLTHYLNSERAYCIPIAHSEGRYYAPEEMLKELSDHDQILFRYCNGEGSIESSANPNGSLLNIAGICNRGRNVFGMMPHPERASEDILGNTDGLALFHSLVRAGQVRKGEDVASYV